MFRIIAAMIFLALAGCDGSGYVAQPPRYFPQMQMPTYYQPAYNPPRTTNCYTFGSTIQCQSF